MPPHENPDPLEAVISRSSRRAGNVVCAALTQTECCQEWICDDAHTYERFSDARNRCYHTHGRLTRCGFRDPERHRGEWKTCTPCRDAFAVDLGTNETHFERLENPPASKPTRCRVCHPRLRLGEDSDGKRADHDIGGSGGAAERSKP
jgi:hypothetical protein